MKTADRLRRRKEKLFARQCGKCHWCGIDIVMPRKGKSEKSFPKNFATLDHLRDRFHPGRRNNSHGTERTVLACWLCNFNRGVESQRNQPIEELRRRAGSMNPLPPTGWKWFDELSAYSRSMGSTYRQCECPECIEIQRGNVQISKRPKETVCKTVGSAFAGSNPSSAHQSRA